jgi:hypothetical protein
MNLRVPQNSEKFLSSCRIGGSSRRAQLQEWRWVTWRYIPEGSASSDALITALSNHRNPGGCGMMRQWITLRYAPDVYLKGLK